jgi:hypothetical protein
LKLCIRDNGPLNAAGKNLLSKSQLLPNFAQFSLQTEILTVKVYLLAIIIEFTGEGLSFFLDIRQNELLRPPGTVYQHDSDISGMPQAAGYRPRYFSIHFLP